MMFEKYGTFAVHKVCSILFKIMFYNFRLSVRHTFNTFHVKSEKTEKNSVPKTDRIINFTDVLYGFEIWPFTLMEESRLRVFENRVLRRIFGPMRDGITGECRKLHNEELNDLYGPGVP